MATDDPSPPASSLSHKRAKAPPHYSQLPSQWLSSYRDFIRENSFQVSSIESALRSLTYILPGRFHASPLTSESLYTALALMTAWHTHLLSPIALRTPQTRLLPQNRYERWCRATGGKMYIRAAALLRTIQYTQLLCEMFAKRAGEKVRWRVVVLLEFVKAVCRLLIMRVTGNRPVIATSIGAENQERVVKTGAMTPSELNHETAESKVNDTSSSAQGNVWNGQVNGAPTAPATPPPTPPEIEYTMPRTGLRLPARLPTPPSSSVSPSLSSPTESISAYLSTRTLSLDDLRPPPRLVRPLTSTRAQLGEILWIIRPVFYSLALQHFATSASTSRRNFDRSWQKSWSPVLIGLSLDLLSRHLSKSAIVSDIPGGLKGLSVVEREELKQRGMFGGSMGWWALRGALYENATSKVVRGVADRLRGKPLLDMLASAVDDYDGLWSQWYFSTATV